MELDGQMERFCQAYLFETKENGTAAAKLAGYAENSAHVQGSRLLRNAKVKARIRELKAQAIRESGYDPKRLRSAVISELCAIGFADITDIMHISPDEKDAKRKEVLDIIAELNDGQRPLDFGEMLVVPTTHLLAETTKAIKSMEIKRDKDGFVLPKIEMHDKKAALLALLDYTDDDPTEIVVSGEVSGNMTIRWADAEPERGEDAYDA